MKTFCIVTAWLFGVIWLMADYHINYSQNMLPNETTTASADYLDASK